MKFKKGDLVQVVPDYALNKRYSGITIQSFMYPLLQKGKVYTINNVSNNRISLKDIGYAWGPDTFIKYTKYNKNLN